ncbi:MAG: lysophospholipid acyltransferase family protein [Pseudomonadota bacterium]
MTQTATEENAIPLPPRRSDRPITIAHRIEYGALVFLLAFFRVIGLDTSSFIAGKFCRVVGPLLKTIHSRGERNLRMIYPDWSEKDIKETLAGAWENIGRTAAEFAHLEKFDPRKDDGRLEIDGVEKVLALAASGEPAIIVSGHFANWELMPVCFFAADIDYDVVYRPANNPLVDELIIKTRGAVMTRRQIPKSLYSLRALFDTLKDGRTLAMLADQKLNDGIEAPFFDRPAMTLHAPARLSLKFGVPIIPAAIARKNGACFKITVKDPIAYAPTGDLHADALAITTLINESLEEDIRAHPDQWLWFHRRWPKDVQ